ncbi:MAG: DUF5317 family protein, partial [Candidatus Limnocylindria bacterium]
MLLSSILVGLVIGALAGGQLPRLAALRLHWVWLLGAALAVRLLAGLMVTTDVGAAFAGAWGLPLTYGLIVVWLYRNWTVPGLQVAAIGVSLNIVAALLNGGKMPVWDYALAAAGLTLRDLVGDPFHVILVARSAAEFVEAGGMFGDVVPIPIPILRDVVSVGDVLLWVGIVWAIVAAMTRVTPGRRAVALGTSPIRRTAASELQLGQAYATAVAVEAETAAAGVAVAEERGGLAAYLRLAANRNYALLWTSQLISLLGDRVHYMALG